MSTKNFRVVGDVSDISRWPVAAFYLDDLKLRVAVARIGDALYAFDDLCTRDECSLASGLLKPDALQIMCQCGGCHFDVTTGAVMRGPATVGLLTYEARQIDDQLEIRI